MIGFSLMALPFLLSTANVPVPKLHLPRLSRRDASAEALASTARRLKALVAEEEAWYADHGRYGKNPFAMARRSGKPDAALERVQVQVLFAGSKGWSAMASHPDAPGKSCVIYVGYRTALPVIPRTRADAADAVAEGAPVCDR